MTETLQYTFIGTRSSASVAAAWAVFESLGFEGFMKTIKRCMSLTTFLSKEIEKLGFQPVTKPTLNIVAFRTSNSKKTVDSTQTRLVHIIRAASRLLKNCNHASCKKKSLSIILERPTKNRIRCFWLFSKNGLPLRKIVSIQVTVFLVFPNCFTKTL